MKDYGRIYGAFWTSSDIRPLGDHAKLLAAYLLTCTHGTISGTFYLPDAYVAEDMQWDIETVSKGFRDLAISGFVSRCDSTKWVWVKKFLEWNKPENPNQWKAVRKMAERVPRKCSWLAEFERLLNGSETVSEPSPQGSTNPVGTVPEPVTVTVSVTGTESPPTPQGGEDASKSRRAHSDLHEQIIATYHEVLPELPAVRDWPERRRRKLQARIAERVKAGKPADKPEYWRSLFTSVQASDFLCGRKGDWRCPGLEWLLEPKNFTKVIEGAYRNHESLNGAHHAR
jgi:hypothetical protein